MFILIRPLPKERPVRIYRHGGSLDWTWKMIQGVTNFLSEWFQKGFLEALPAAGFVMVFLAFSNIHLGTVEEEFRRSITNAFFTTTFIFILSLVVRSRMSSRTSVGTRPRRSSRRRRGK